MCDMEQTKQPGRVAVPEQNLDVDDLIFRADPGWMVSER